MDQGSSVGRVLTCWVDNDGLSALQLAENLAVIPYSACYGPCPWSNDARAGQGRKNLERRNETVTDCIQ